MAQSEPTGQRVFPSMLEPECAINFGDIRSKTFVLPRLDSKSFHAVKSSNRNRGYGKTIHIICQKNIGHLSNMLSSKHIALLPWINQSTTLPDLIKSICRNIICDVWIYQEHGSSTNVNWKSFVFEMIRERRSVMSVHSLPSCFDIKLLVPNKTVVEEWNDIASLMHIVYNESSKDGQEKLLTSYDSRVRYIAESFRDKAPILEMIISIEIDDIENDSAAYTEAAYKAANELIQDPSTYVRQEFQLLHKIPNVRVRPAESFSMEGMKVEIRPTELDQFGDFVTSYENGTLTSVVQERLNVSGQPLRGSISISMDQSDIKSVSERLEIERKDDPVSFDSGRDPQNMTLKNIVLSVLYKSHLTDSSKTPYEFLQVLKSIGCLGLLPSVYDVNGENILHMAVSHQRTDFLWMVYYRNHWGSLRSDTIKVATPENGASHRPSHKGYTAYRLAEALAYKVKGYDVLCEMHDIEELWLELPILCKASLSGKIEIAKVLLETTPELIHEKDRQGGNCLFSAAASGNVALVTYLMQAGADINALNSRIESAAHVAAKFGHTDILMQLDSKTQMLSAFKRNSDGCCAADFAAMNGDLPTLEFFSRHKLLPSCVMFAAKHKKPTALRYFIDECKVPIEDGRDIDGRCALHHAAINGDMDTLDILLKAGARLFVVDRYNRTAFHLAAQHNQLDVIERLLQEAIRLNSLDSMINEQDYYSGREHQFLVRGRDQGRRAWHWVQLKPLHHHAFTKDLSSGQIDVAIHGNILFSGFGSSPGKVENDAIKEKQNEMLIRRIPNMTPLHMAVNKDYVEMVEALVRFGAQVNVKSFGGVSPIHLAAMRGNLRTVQLLEQAGADFQSETDQGETPIDIAQDNLHTEVINYMEGAADMQKARIFIDQILLKKQAELMESTLDEKRESGKDLKRHLVSLLRDMTIDINELLVSIGSGPIMEES